MQDSTNINQQHDRFQLQRAEVVQLLNSYIPADPEEAEHRQTIINFLRESSRPFDPRSFAPGHITGSALIFDDCNRKVLLIYHRRLNRWIQPGGHVMPEDPHLVETAIREVREEVDLSFPPSVARLFDVDVHEIPSFGSDPQHLHFDFRFLIRCRETRVDATSDASDARWFRIGEAMEQSKGKGTKRLLLKCQELET